MKFASLLTLVTLSVTFSTSLGSAADVPGDVSAEAAPKPPAVPPHLAKLPKVNSKDLQKRITKARLLHHAKQFQSFADLTPGNRAFGSKGHNATIAYIKNLLDKTKYYDTELQTFPYTYAESSSTFATLKADGGSEAYPTKSLFYAPSGNVTAKIVALDNVGCELADYPSSVVDNLVLVERGVCGFGQKVALAGAAKAAGIIIFNDVDAELSGGSLSTPTNPLGPYVPVGTIAGIAGRALKARILGGEEVVGKLDAYGIVEERYSSNLIATSRVGDRRKVIMSGSHSDSVPSGPGINDDGSGSMANLEIALQLSHFSVPNAVRFAWWTAEEFGLVGSTYHVTRLSPADIASTVLYLNFDMIASPNSGFFIYNGKGDVFGRPGPKGSDAIEKLYEDWYIEKGLISRPSNLTGRSDYGPFIEVGVPVGGVFTGHEAVKTEEQVKWWGGEANVRYDPCYHSKCDTLENLRLETFETNAKAAAHSIATYSTNLKGFPFPRPAPAVASFGEARKPHPVELLTYEERTHYGCNDHHEVIWE